jgi:hypothetical protein
MRRKLTTVDKRSLSHNRKGRPLLGKLVTWTVLALLFLVLTAVVFYIIGSYRKVSDASQLALIRFCLGVSLLLIIFSVYGFVLELYYVLREKKPVYLAFALGYVLIMALGAATVFGAAFIINAVKGGRS